MHIIDFYKAINFIKPTHTPMQFLRFDQIKPNRNYQRVQLATNYAKECR